MLTIIERSGAFTLALAATMVTTGCHLGGQSFDDGKDGLGGVRTRRDHEGSQDASVTGDAAYPGVTRDAAEPGVTADAAGPDITTVTVDPGVSPVESVSRLDADVSPVEPGSPEDAGDSGTTTFDSGSQDPNIRICSEDPADTATRTCDLRGENCVTELTRNDCQLGWGCGDYSTAVAGALAQCAVAESFYAYEACGFSVIERLVGAGDLIRAFYNSSGALVGTWSITDTLNPERCSGSVPKACIDWELESPAVGLVDLCDTDAG